MPKPNLLTKILLAVVIVAGFAAFLWWRQSVDDRLGYCQTPQQTCINREGFAVGEPCECHGMGGGVFGLELDGKGHPEAIETRPHAGHNRDAGVPSRRPQPLYASPTHERMRRP